MDYRDEEWVRNVVDERDQLRSALAAAEEKAENYKHGLRTLYERVSFLCSQDSADEDLFQAELAAAKAIHDEPDTVREEAREWEALYREAEAERDEARAELETMKAGWQSVKEDRDEAHAGYERVNHKRSLELEEHGKTLEELRALRSRVAELEKVEHAAWHLLDNSEHEVEPGRILVQGADFERLSSLLPEDHPTAALAGAEGPRLIGVDPARPGSEETFKRRW